MTEESDRERPQDREIAEKARAGLEQMRTLREDLDETIELTEQYLAGDATVAELDDHLDQTEVLKNL